MVICHVFNLFRHVAQVGNVPENCVSEKATQTFNCLKTNEQRETI